MFKDITTRLCLYDPGISSDSPVAAIKKIAEEEAKKQRSLELAEVTSIYPHMKNDDNDNYECDVKLRNGGNELRKVPIMTPHIGFTWVPNIGDLVLIGYIGGNVNSPVVIGSLYNDDQRPPVSNANRIIQALPEDIALRQYDAIEEAWEGFEWDVNGIISSMRKLEDGKVSYVSFSDSLENSFHVLYDMSGAGRIIFNKNLIIAVSKHDAQKSFEYRNVTGDEEILISADKDITIECGGKLKIKASSIELTGSISMNGDIAMNGGAIKAKGTQLDLEGNAIEIKGSGQVTIKGATVDVNGSGTTTIKGGIVKIN